MYCTIFVEQLILSQDCMVKQYIIEIETKRNVVQPQSLALLLRPNQKGGQGNHVTEDWSGFEHMEVTAKFLFSCSQAY